MLSLPIQQVIMLTEPTRLPRQPVSYNQTLKNTIKVKRTQENFLKLFFVTKTIFFLTLVWVS